MVMDVKARMDEHAALVASAAEGLEAAGAGAAPAEADAAEALDGERLATTFNDAETEVLKLMGRDAFSRFKRTALFEAVQRNYFDALASCTSEDEALLAGAASGVGAVPRTSGSASGSGSTSPSDAGQLNHCRSWSSTVLGGRADAGRAEWEVADDAAERGRCVYDIMMTVTTFRANPVLTTYTLAPPYTSMIKQCHERRRPPAAKADSTTTAEGAGGGGGGGDVRRRAPSLASTTAYPRERRLWGGVLISRWRKRGPRAFSGGNARRVARRKHAPRPHICCQVRGRHVDHARGDARCARDVRGRDAVGSRRLQAAPGGCRRLQAAAGGCGR